MATLGTTNENEDASEPSSNSRTASKATVHLTPEERALRGKAARAEVPRSSHAGFDASAHRPRPGRAARGAGDRRGSPSWCRSATAGCSSRRSPSTGARRCIMAADLAGDAELRAARPALRRRPPVELRRASPRPSGGWSSTSTTSTRRCRGRGSGTSSASRRASRSPAASNGFGRRDAIAIVLRGRRASTASAMREFAGMRNLEVWYARIDVEELMPRARSRRSATRSAQDAREEPGEGADQGQHAGAREAHARGRRRAADHQRPAADRPDRGAAPDVDARRARRRARRA